MQINNNGITNNTNSSSGSQKTGSSTKVESKADAVASQGDSVELSDTARVMTELEAKIATVSDVDSARVASIQQAIADGSYTVNPEKIADKMLGGDQLF